MSHRIARDKDEFQVLSRSKVSGKVLFEPKRWRRFPLRFAMIWYEYNRELVAETTTDNEGRFSFDRVPGLGGVIICSMKCILDNEEIFDLHPIGGGEYRYRFPRMEKGTIDSIDMNSLELEIVITEEEWQPDLLLREILIEHISGTPSFGFEDELKHLYDDEIDAEEL